MRADESMTVTAAEFHRNPGRYQDEAMTKTVTITKNGRSRVVLVPAEEYARLRRRDQQAIAAGELSERQIEAIRRAAVPAEHGKLNEELAGWKP